MAGSDGATAGAGAVGTGVMDERRFLIALAFRMLGTIADAEDAVQETHTRWYRMDQAGRDAIGVPCAWLTRVASRMCLDMLCYARVRRERYAGPWLPELCRLARSRTRPGRTRSMR